MTNVWCVRAEYGTFAKQFVDGGYVAIGWMKDVDLSQYATKDDVARVYREHHPKDTNLVVGQQVGQISRFLLEMKAGDYVITPSADTENLHYGEVTSDPPYYAPSDAACPYPQRRRVRWSPQTIGRSSFSVPFQNTIRSSLTVFGISRRDEFMTVIGRKDLVVAAPVNAYDPYRTVLDQVLQLDAAEFEILVGHLLTALGFEGSEVTGKSGDGGVDATGELNVANLAKVKVFVQAKRYQIGHKVATKTVRELRQAIPFGGQGAFITTSDFQLGAAEIALEPNFPRIGLVNGHQLVDLLIEHWDDIPPEFQEQLGLRPGLVRA